MKRYKIYIFIILIIPFLLESCKSLKPEKPEEVYIEKPYENPPSWLNVPIEIPLSKVVNHLNKEITGLIFEDSSYENNGNDRMLCKVWKRDNIKITYKDDYFYFTVPLKIWAKAGFKAETFGIDLSQYKETEMEIDVRFKSMLGVSDKWKVTPVTSPDGYQWIKKPSVKLGIFEISLTPILDQILENQQEIIAKELDKEIQSRVDVKPYIQKAWEQIQQPLELSKQYNAWLRIKPSEIMMTPLKVKGDQIVTYIGIKGFAETFLGKKPEFIVDKKLPPLQTITKIQDRFQIALIGEISHTYAKKLAEDNFVGQTYTFNKDKYKIKIMGLDLYGSNGKLVLKLLIDGSIDGEIYLKGTPVFEESTSTLVIQNMEYDIKTKNALIKAADWMNHGNFVKTIEKNFRIPLGKEIEETKKLIRQNLNNNRVSNNIVLNGNLEKLSPGEVYIGKESIKASINAEGQVQVKIDGFL